MTISCCKQMFLFLDPCQDSFCSSRLWSQTLNFLIIKMKSYIHAVIYKLSKMSRSGIQGKSNCIHHSSTIGFRYVRIYTSEDETVIDFKWWSYSTSLGKDDIVTSIERSLYMMETVMVLPEVSQSMPGKSGFVSPCLQEWWVIDQYEALEDQTCLRCLLFAP